MTKRHLLRTLERERQAFAAERAMLLDRICHLAGKPWTPAPSAEPTVKPEPRATVRYPEQYPDNYDLTDPEQYRAAFDGAE